MDKIQMEKVIGENISKYRERAGLTQAQLAERVGVGIPFISKVERGGSAMKLHTLYKFAEALDVSCDALLYPESAAVHISSITRLLKDRPLNYLVGIENLIRTCDEHFTARDTISPQDESEVESPDAS